MKYKLFTILLHLTFVLANNTQLELVAQSKPGLKTKLKQFEIEGNEKISNKALQDWFNYKKNDFITESDFNQRCAGVLEKYKKRGYLFSKIDSVQFHYNRDSSLVDVFVHLQEGKILIINEIDISGVSEDDREILLELQTRSGNKFQEEVLQDDIEYILTYFENKGYPYCKVNIVGFNFKKFNLNDESSLDIRLQVAPGPEVNINDIEIRGNDQTKDYVVKRETGVRQGEYYDQRKVDKIRPNLMKLGYFKWVNPPALEWQDDGFGKLIIELAEGNNNRFNGVLGYNPASTNSKGYITGLIDISFRNLLGTGRQIEVHWERRTEKTQQLKLRYLEPWIAGLPLNAGVSFEQLIQDTSYVQRNIGLDLRLLLNNYLSFFTQVTKKNISPDSLAAILFHIPSSSSMHLSVGVTFNTLEHWLNPRKGIHYQTSFEWGRKTINNTANDFDTEAQPGSFNQKIISIDFESYFSLFRWQVIAVGLHGRQITSNEAVIPITDQFRFGGTRDLRGYREEQFRGSRITWANIEYRFLLNRNSRFFAFLDAGYYFRKELISQDMVKFEDAKIGYGIGLRLDTKLGYFGIDYGLGEGDGLSNGKVHISLTNEF